MVRRSQTPVSRLFFLGVCVLTISVSPVLAGAVLIGGTSDGILYDIDPASGTLSNPRDTGLYELTSLAFSPDGTLFAHGEAEALGASSLYSIDVGSGAPHAIAATGLSLAHFAYDAQGHSLIAIAARAGTGAGRLQHIDTQTGVATPGALASPFAPVATNSAGALFSLYPLDASESELARRHIITGDVLQRWTIPTSIAFPGIVFAEDGRLLISDTGDGDGAWLRAFDLDTGGLSTVGPLGADVVALAYIPEPSTLVLLCCALGLLVWHRRGLAGGGT